MTADQNDAARPATLSTVGAIPSALRALPQWVCWRYETRNGKQTKAPIDAKSNEKVLHAKTNNPATWADFETAIDTANRLNLMGIGFCLAPDDGLTGLDLDHVIGPDTGEIDPRAAEIIERFKGTYCEVSPSGTGLRLFCYGKPGRSGKNIGAAKWLEVYSHPSSRYLTITGNYWPGSARNVTDQQDALDWLHDTFMTEREAPAPASLFASKMDSTGRGGAARARGPSGPNDLTDEQIIEKAHAAANGVKFARLWSGDASGNGGDDSAADYALANILAFWTDGDHDRIDRLFRHSGLMRPKWDEIHYADGSTYGQKTTDRAVRDLKVGYSGRRPCADRDEEHGARRAEGLSNKGNAQQAQPQFEVLGELKDGETAIVATDKTSAQAINEASGFPVIVAGTPGKLWNAAQMARGGLPRLKILVAGNADTGDKAKTAAYGLIGGSYWVTPDCLTACFAEIDAEAMRVSGGKPYNDMAFDAARRAVEERDKARVEKGETANTFAALAAWNQYGTNRVGDQIRAGIRMIGVIRVEPGRLPQIVSQAEKELLFAQIEFYQRAGMLVRPSRIDKATEQQGVMMLAGTLVISTLDKPWLTWQFARAARWEKFDGRNGLWRPVDPPPKYAETMLSKSGDWRAQVLAGIVESPTLRPDGSLILANGYDKASGLYLDYRGDPVIVKDTPILEDARAALAVLSEPFEEFAFADDELGLSVILAGLLTAIVRPTLPSSPLFAIDAPVMGAGKGLLVDVVSMIATGRNAPAIAQGKDEAEDEKRLGALLLRGATLANIDNIERPLQGDLLCSLLTQSTVAVRILGKSEMPELPTRMTLFATGNNLVAKGDMIRRMLLCRLDPGCERPDARTFKRNLKEWVPQNRARLLTAALTVLRAYIVAGKPKQLIDQYGSFEAWSDLVRSALMWCGMTDPNRSRGRVEAEDPVKEALESVLVTWRGAFGDRPLTVQELITQVEFADLRHALLDVAASPCDPNRIDSKKLGYWLKKHQGRVIGGLNIEKTGICGHEKVVLWTVAAHAFAGDAGDAGLILANTRKMAETKRFSLTKKTGGLESFPALSALSASSADSDYFARFAARFAPPPPVDSKPSATEGEAAGGGGQRRELPFAADADMRSLWSVLRLATGGLDEKVIAKKCGGWSVQKVVAIAGRLRDLGYARITGARIEPVWPDKAVAP